MKMARRRRGSPCRQYGENESTNTWEAVTDSRGEYRMSEIVPGEFYLVVRPPLAFQDSGPLRRQPELGADGKPLPLTDFSPVWYGNTPYRSHAATIRIAEGDECAPVDFVVRRVALVTVRGRLLSGVSGRPVNAERLDFVPEGETGFLGGHGSSLAIIKLENGAFEVSEVTAGSYRLIARASEDGERISVEEIVEVGSEERNINVVLKPPGEIKGVLRVEGNSRLPKEARLRLASAAAEIASDGSFSFQRDPASDLPLWLQSSGFYLKAATLNGQRIAPVRMNYPANCPCTLELVAGTDGRTVRIRIEVPKIAPAGPIQVADFYLDGQTPWPARVFETDEEEIVLPDLPSGRHRLLAWSGVAPCNPREPLSCSSFGRLIDTSASGSHEVTLPLEVEGRR